jgi:hypothetical protein
MKPSQPILFSFEFMTMMMSSFALACLFSLAGSGSLIQSHTHARRRSSLSASTKLLEIASGSEFLDHFAITQETENELLGRNLMKENPNPFLLFLSNS